VVHFNPSSSNVPVFNVGRVPLARKVSFDYLGMMFYKRMSMVKSFKHVAGPFMGSAFWVRQFVRDNSLVNRQYVSLWLGKTYVLPTYVLPGAGMYAGQV
jgi:hypothetical protein